jgi:hypothetical protein
MSWFAPCCPGPPFSCPCANTFSNWDVNYSNPTTEIKTNARIDEITIVEWIVDFISSLVK